MNNYPIVSLIFINYNGEKYLEKCFSSLFKTRYPKEKMQVIMVDNDSNDGSVNFVRKNFTHIKIIKAPNEGYGAGANRGFAESKGELIGILNIDLEFTPNWLLPLVKKFQSTPDLGIASPLLIPFTGEKKQKYIAIPSYSPFGFAYNYEIKYNQKPIKALWMSGASLLIKRKVYEQIGGFDQNLFLFFEDFDICFRAVMTGYAVMLLPQSIVRHKESGVINTVYNIPAKVRMGVQNNTLVILKNYSDASLMKFFLPYLILRLIDIFNDVIHIQNIRYAKAKAEGLLSVFPLLPKIMVSRRVVQSKRKIKDSEIFKNNYPFNLYYMIKGKL